MVSEQVAADCIKKFDLAVVRRLDHLRSLESRDWTAPGDATDWKSVCAVSALTENRREIYPARRRTHRRLARRCGRGSA